MMRDDPKRERRSIPTTLGRSLRLRCPACGRASVFERPFHVRHHCPACRALFKREEGFFVGAIAVNLVSTELVTLALYLVGILFIDFQTLFTVLFATALLLPAVFYHHSWSFWLGGDYFVESLPKYEGEAGGDVKGGHSAGGNSVGGNGARGG